MLLRWLRLPEFESAYREARRDTFSKSIARLRHASSAAVSTLLKVMIDLLASAASRIRVADYALGHAARGIEIEDIEVRVKELERAAETAKPRRMR